jgi:uncharacterized damage-inducible protein DinB
MTTIEAQELFSYNRWANQQVLAAVQPLSAADFVRDLKSSFPSIRDTLVHVLGAEWLWLRRWNGVSPREHPPEWKSLGYAELLVCWREHETEQAAFVDQLTESMLAQPLSYRNTRGESFQAPLEQLVRHVVNHSSYHRGQVTTMLRQLGCTAASSDLVLYHRTVAARPESAHAANNR